MTLSEMHKWAVVCLALVPALVLSALPNAEPKSPRAAFYKPQKRSKSSAFKTEFMAWAAKQDWFTLSKSAKFGDFDREKSAEIGRTFGYSVEFVDSKGTEHILGIGLAKEPKMEDAKEMKRDMAEMSAKSSIMTHGKAVPKDASGRQSQSFNGTLQAQTVLSKTIVRPGTEEKWILCVCAKIRGANH